MNNWRGLWMGAIIIAQKIADDQCLRTGTFAAILPGASRGQLKAAERTVFELLDCSAQVKPSTYVRFYFELRWIFLAIAGRPPYRSRTADGQPMPPLRKAEGERLCTTPDEPPEPSQRKLRTATKEATNAYVPKPSHVNQSRGERSFRRHEFARSGGSQISEWDGGEPGKNCVSQGNPPARQLLLGQPPSSNQKSIGRRDARLRLREVDAKSCAITPEDRIGVPSRAIFVLN
jgi:hypothetical protein